MRKYWKYFAEISRADSEIIISNFRKIFKIFYVNLVEISANFRNYCNETFLKLKEKFDLINILNEYIVGYLENFGKFN